RRLRGDALQGRVVAVQKRDAPRPHHPGQAGRQVGRVLHPDGAAGEPLAGRLLRPARHEPAAPRRGGALMATSDHTTVLPGGAANFLPVGPFSTVSDGHGGTTTLLLGASDLVGRDEFLRLLAGAQVSLEVGILATLVGLTLGLVLGLLAGFYGGIIDTIVSR